MSLIHDPSAIRFASTQEAYGQLWTLDKVESELTIADIDLQVHKAMYLSPVDLAIRARDAKRKQNAGANSLKPSTIFGYYSQEAVLAGCAVFTYRDERNAIHQLTRYEFSRADKCHWSDCQFVGEFPIGNYIETIKQPTLAGQQVWWKNQAV